MRRVNVGSFATTVALGIAAGFAVPAGAQAQGVTAFEGARIIVGDGRVIENGTLIVSGSKITQIGGTVPAGATRVNLAGKTVMPTLVDAHVHLSATRDKVV